MDKNLDQFRDCAGRPEKEGFLISKDQVGSRLKNWNKETTRNFQKTIYKEVCQNESDFYEFLSKENSSLEEFITEYHGLESFEYNGELSQAF